jgi:O-6-methylguanine DNA methyltransferase
MTRIPRRSVNGGGELSRFELAVPIGVLAISGCSVGIHELKFKHVNQEEDTLRVIADSSFQNVSRLVFEEGNQDHEMRKECLSYFEDYFSGSFRGEHTIKLPSICWSHTSKADSFGRKVLRSLYETVAVGQKVSYKKLASLAGNANVSRAVGTTLRKNSVPIIIPCHRVITSSKGIGNYNCGVAIKQWLLDFEEC